MGDYDKSGVWHDKTTYIHGDNGGKNGKLNNGTFQRIIKISETL